jgi:hypothetical protein
MAPEHTSRITGQEAIVKIPNSNDGEIAVTNVSFDIDVNTTDVQTNQGHKPDIATTGLRYSGSFEYDGEQDVIRNKLFYSAGDKDANGDKIAGAGAPYDPGEPKRVNMTVKEEAPAGDGGDSGNLSRTWTLENVLITGMSRDIPSDDVASTSWDFEAEDAYVSDGGAAGGSSRSE